jgi:hypothetical protein
MAISDIFSTSFLFSIAIIIILLGGIFAYVSYRMAEQDHKLNSMIGLVSTMAEESQFFRSKLSMLHQKLSTQDLPAVDKIQYASQMMGGEAEELIDVSDEEDDEEEEEEEDDMDDSDSEGSEQDDEEEEEEDGEEENTDEEYIKRLNLTLANDELNVKIPYEEIDVGDESYEGSNNLADFESTNLEETDIHLSPEDHMATSNELKHDEDFLKNVSITDFGEGTLSLGEIEDIHTTKSDYKKMSLNKLREVVVSKGVIADASKLKKNEILKLLGDE